MCSTSHISLSRVFVRDMRCACERPTAANDFHWCSRRCAHHDDPALAAGNSQPGVVVLVQASVGGEGGWNTGPRRPLFDLMWGGITGGAWTGTVADRALYKGSVRPFACLLVGPLCLQTALCPGVQSASVRGLFKSSQPRAARDAASLAQSLSRLPLPPPRTQPTVVDVSEAGVP